MSEMEDHDKPSFNSRSPMSKNSDHHSRKVEEEDSSKNMPKPPMMEKDTKEVTRPPATRDKRSADDKDGSGGEHKDEENDASGGDGLNHDKHTRTERGRRKKMRDMFANLHALLRQLPPKVDKSTIVEEAIKQIGTLEKILRVLEKRKLEKLQRSVTPSPSSCVNYNPKMATSQKHTTNSREAFLVDQRSPKNNSSPVTPTSFWISQRSPPSFRTWKFPYVTLNVCGRDAHICICCPKKAGLLTAVCYVLEKHKVEVIFAQISSDHQRSMCMIQARANRACNSEGEEAFEAEEIYKQAAGEINLFVNSSR